MTEEGFAILKQNQRLAAGRPLRSKRAVTMSEAEMERTCTAMLVQDGWRPLKTSPVSRRARGVGFGELGMADYLYLRYRRWETLEDDLNRRKYLADKVATGQIRQEDADKIQAIWDSQAQKAEGCQIMWIEWKRADGEAAPHQLAWIEAERAKGALVWLAGVDFEATPDAFWAHYQASGLCRSTQR